MTIINPLSPHDALNTSFYIPENRLNIPTIRGYRTKISTKLVDQYIIFVNFQTTANHLHPLQVDNCDSNSRLVVDEDDNGKFRLERVEDSLSRRPTKSDVTDLYLCWGELLCLARSPCSLAFINYHAPSHW